ncbi:uncharacterized protein LOC110880685 [Helianthus annuus]|uniref:uncharacterized protein LOC110880685 n=1 Tax=Helianthus annuus TaxID=4232 RepID=UPI000B8F66F9|nr:uncharacterized protein LOC110880685 [Helianthus annuus]
MGVEGKAGWCRNLRKEHEINFMLIQESLCMGIEDKVLESFWGRGDFGFEVVDPTGRSGGLFTMWDCNFFDFSSVIKDRFFLLISGTLKGSGEIVNVLNIYAPQKSTEKRRLWDTLVRVISSNEGLWILGGDFNSVRCIEERRNSRFNAAAANDFIRFISEAGLVEFGLKSGKFTYAVGNKLSRIDRFFVCEDFVNKWPTTVYKILPRGKSDHNPVLLHTFSSNFGPKPFRFFNSWLDRKDFKLVVLKANGEFSFVGPSDVRLMHKFRCMRQAITTWRNEVNAMEKQEESVLVQEMLSIEKTLEVRDLEEEEVWTWEEGKKRLSQLDFFVVKISSNAHAINGLKTGMPIANSSMV